LLIQTVALVLLSVPVGSVHGEPRDAPAATPLLPVEDAYPHVSRSGLLVFQSNRVGGSKLFVATSDGSGLRQLTVGAGDDVTPKWSPDGSRIAFASTRDDDIYVVNVDGSALRRLTDNGEDGTHSRLFLRTAAGSCSDACCAGTRARARSPIRKSWR
jgi:dipeptidyl aminopeptidase/acylaminoacyl peptidase